VRLITEPAHAIRQWVGEHAGWAPCHECMTALGIIDGIDLVAGAVFNCHTGPSIEVHIALTDPHAFRPLARYVWRYVHGELGCHRLTLVIASTNMRMLDIACRLGAIHEGTLAGASRSGDDILLFRLERGAEFWRKLRG
jgi:hypothetical protein